MAAILPGQPFCGDGNRDAQEGCDDGNRLDSDAVHPCVVEPIVDLEQGQIDCRTLIPVCNCDNGDVCIDACVADASLLGATRFSALTDCVVQNQCNEAADIDDDCLDENCRDEYLACFGAQIYPRGQSTCEDLVACETDVQIPTVYALHWKFDGASLEVAVALDECVFDENNCPNRVGIAPGQIARSSVWPALVLNNQPVQMAGSMRAKRAMMVIAWRETAVR